MDEDKVIKASDLVKDPNMVYRFLNQYIMVADSSLAGTYNNMLQSINMLSERGWEVVTFTRDSSNMMFTLFRNTQWKLKNVED